MRQLAIASSERHFIAADQTREGGSERRVVMLDDRCGRQCVGVHASVGVGDEQGYEAQIGGGAAGTVDAELTFHADDIKFIDVRHG